eukprot:765171-Hanusia_phi.AAC.4
MKRPRGDEDEFAEKRSRDAQLVPYGEIGKEYKEAAQAMAPGREEWLLRSKEEQEKSEIAIKSILAEEAGSSLKEPGQDGQYEEQIKLLEELQERHRKKKEEEEASQRAIQEILASEKREKEIVAADEELAKKIAEEVRDLVVRTAAHLCLQERINLRKKKEAEDKMSSEEVAKIASEPTRRNV